VLNATALVTAIGDGRTFHRGRDFAAWFASRQLVKERQILLKNTAEQSVTQLEYRSPWLFAQVTDSIGELLVPTRLDSLVICDRFAAAKGH
jgi:hypothetical protein